MPYNELKSDLVIEIATIAYQQKWKLSKNKILYLDKERAFDPERDRDLERDLESLEDFPFGDLLQVNLPW